MLLVLLLGTSPNSENYPQRYSSDLQLMVKPCETQLSYSLSAPRKWERPITSIARTHPLYRGASREKAADPRTPVPTWKNQWFDT